MSLKEKWKNKENDVDYIMADDVNMIAEAVIALEDKEEIDPTVPGWAKQPEKPTYTAEEVGALAKEDKAEIVQEVLAAIPVGDEVEY